MAHPKHREDITAIVPAYNEELGLAGVLRIITSHPRIHEVIVVDDGSTDATLTIARAFNVRIIHNETNIGKGASMDRAVQACSSPYLLFCDADMIGLSHAMLDSLIDPVVEGKSDMVVAMRNWNMFYARFVLSFIPLLGGQRALTRVLWMQVPSEYKDRFMIETALNFYARYWGRGYTYVVARGLRQVIKEQKYGVVQGFRARVKMFAQVFACQLKLQLKEVPRTLKTGRIALTNIVAGVIGVVFGSVVVYAAFAGPYGFVRDLAERELLQDPDAPFIQFLLYSASHVGADLLALTGAILIALNALVIVFNLNNIRYLAYAKAPVDMIGEVG